MRKIIFCIAAVVAMCLAASCTQCSNDAHWGVEYSLTSNGKTDGNVKVCFPGGSFFVDGDAGYDFDWSNAKDSVALKAVVAMPLDSVLQKQMLDKDTMDAAKYVNGWLDEQVKIASFEGHYDIYVKGYVKETKTQITFSIDRHFTNVEE